MELPSNLAEQVETDDPRQHQIYLIGEHSWTSSQTNHTQTLTTNFYWQPYHIGHATVHHDKHTTTLSYQQFRPTDKILDYPKLATLATLIVLDELHRHRLYDHHIRQQSNDEHPLTSQIPDTTVTLDTYTQHIVDLAIDNGYRLDPFCFSERYSSRP